MILTTLTLIGYAVILYVLTTGLLNKCSSFTTIGTKIWFGDIISSITERLGENKLSKWIRKFSYNKLFVCEPCHVFWLTQLTGFILGTILSLNILIVMLLIVTPIALIGYFNKVGENIRINNEMFEKYR